MKALAMLGTSLGVMLAWYLCAVFVTLEPDVRQWTEEGRYMFIACSLCSAFGAAGTVNIYWKGK